MKRIICALTIIIILIILGLHKLGVTFFEYSGTEEGIFVAYIQSDPKEKNYTNYYEALIDGKKFILYIKKSNAKLEIGDKIKFNGTFNKPNKSRNYNGFDYELYLKTKKIYGSFIVDNYEKINNKNSHNLDILWKKFIAKVKNKIKDTVEKNLSKENAQLLLGLLIGEKEYIDKDIINSFRDASLSHILAISGAHFAYILLFLKFICKKLKRNTLGKILTILIIIFFMQLTGNTPSVTRAGMTSILMILASLLHRKNDFWTSLCLTLLIQIVYNPYVIFDIGLILSYSGVIGIVTFYNIIKNKVKLKLLSVTLSANLIITPVMMYNFNTIYPYFIISNYIASILLGPIIILGFISTVLNFKFIYTIENLLLTILINSSKFCANLPMPKIYVATPTLISIIVFYALLIYIYMKKNIKKNIRNNTRNNIKNNPRKNVKNNLNKKVIALCLIIVILTNVNVSIFINNKLVINFIDVGQGDSCLIRIKDKSILIDGGGTADKNSNYDVGKNVLLPYLLSRKITRINYIVISHFDTDHVGGLFTILKELKVEKVIICKQIETSENYENFKRLVNENKINVIEVSKGDILNFDKELKMRILWPKEEQIRENILNNNSIVAKLEYKNFSMLFTGDIEKIAENEILKEYHSNLTELKSSILKVAHHGSKTSSTEKFLEAVNPKIAIIGVGENNKFGHPNDEVINRIENMKCKIYRTDKMGEITITITKNGRIKMQRYIIT